MVGMNPDNCTCFISHVNIHDYLSYLVTGVTRRQDNGPKTIIVLELEHVEESIRAVVSR